MTARTALQPIASALFVLGLCNWVGPRRATPGVIAGVVLWIVLELFLERRSARSTPPDR